MLQACLNGNRDKGFHAATPLSPRELAANARAVIDAGAHELHPRDAAGRARPCRPGSAGDARHAVLPVQLLHRHKSLLPAAGHHVGPPGRGNPDQGARSEAKFARQAFLLLSA